MCLIADTCLTTDPGVASSIPARSHFVENDHEIISTGILLLLIQERVVVSYKLKYVHEVLVHCLNKLAQGKKVWLVGIDCPDMTIAVDWDEKHQTKQKPNKGGTCTCIYKLSTKISYAGRYVGESYQY